MAGATREGTFAYVKKFGSYSKDFYRFDGTYFVSSLGLGTFKSEPYKEDRYVINFAEAIKKAVRQGVNLIDTAINYRYQMSEREIKEALDELLDSGDVTRDALVITSKAGFIPLDFPFPENPYRWIEHHIINQGLATRDEIIADQHCMAPAYIKWSANQSLKNLGLETIDIFYLHNPEMQLGEVDRAVVYERIKDAFRALEELVAEGKIGCYGVATWNAFLYEEDHAEYLSLRDMVNLAREVAGDDHHLKYIQLPYNLAKPHPYNYTNQPLDDGLYYTPFQAAQALGLQVMTSSPLLQMNLFKKSFAKGISEKLGTSMLSDVQTALQFARCGGGVSAIFGAVDPEHVEANLSLAYIPAAKPQAIRDLFGMR